jgi:hypothetical protein
VGYAPTSAGLLNVRTAPVLCQYSATPNGDEGEDRVAGVLLGERVYGRLHRTVLRRREVADFLVKHAHDCLPALAVAAVDVVKLNDNDEFAIDVIAIDFLASRWWAGIIVTEVTDLERDVVLPVRWARQAQYLTDEAKDIASKFPGKEAEVESLIIAEQPCVTAFVSNPMPEWFSAVHSVDGNLAITEVFQAPTGHQLWRVNGELPVAQGTKIAEGTVLTGNIVSVASMPSLQDDEIRCIWEGEEIGCTINRVSSQVLLYLNIDLGLPISASVSVWQVAATTFSLRHEDTTK